MSVNVKIYDVTQLGYLKPAILLLRKVLACKQRCVVVCGEREQLSALDAALWLDPNSFLAHGCQGEPDAEEAPIYLTTEITNPNAAQVLVLCNATSPEKKALHNFQACLDLVQSHDDSKSNNLQKKLQYYLEISNNVDLFNYQDGKWIKAYVEGIKT